MKTNLLTLFVLSYWQISQSANYQGTVEKDTKNQVHKIRSYLDRVIENTSKKYARGIPIGEETGNEDDYDSDGIVGELTDLNDDRGVFERNGFKFGFDAGNPDIHSNLKRSCQAYDTFCIRKYFAEHSHCKISGRAVPDPLYRAQATVNFVSSNISETQINAIYTGLNNARVTEFYANEVTDKLIIALTFDNATRFSKYNSFSYHLRGREPVVTTDFKRIQYGVLTVTVIIPQLNDLRLDKAEMYTYGDNNIFQFALGPNIGASTDPEVQYMFGRFNSNIPTNYQEEISNQGNFLAGNYIQYNICDFGLKVL